MIGDIFQPTHLLFILVVALLVLGPKRLPEAGRAVGSAIRDFRSAVSGEHDQPSELPTQAPAPPPTMAFPVAPPVEPAAQGATTPTEPTEQTEQNTETEPAETAEPAETVHPIA
jgi:sec-independent protein translocase protein TatA